NRIGILVIRDIRVRKPTHSPDTMLQLKEGVRHQQMIGVEEAQRAADAVRSKFTNAGQQRIAQQVHAVALGLQILAVQEGDIYTLCAEDVQSLLVLLASGLHGFLRAGEATA